MSDKPLILLCDPIMKANEHHLGHLMKWYAANEHTAKWDMDLHLKVGQALQKVQKGAVEKARRIGASHILWTEHDHWGYPVDGLEVLLEYDKDVIGLQTYQRSYPFQPMQMRQIDPSISFLTGEINLAAFGNVEPIEQTDLITWAFTLTKMSVFDRIDEGAAQGLFSDDEPWIWDKVPTDSHFCECCKILGIERWICAEGMVNHGDIPPEDILIWRRAFDSVYAKRNMFPKEALDYEHPLTQADEDHGDEIHYVPEAEEAIEAAKAANEEGVALAFDYQAEGERLEQSNDAKAEAAG